MDETTDALVIGGGPAGLMAAEMLSAANASVILAEAKPSIGRKFLMAGKSGLNLTKDEPIRRFLSAYGASEDWLAPILETFDPEDVTSWTLGLGQEVFSGSTGRVFPKSMKASPLLRAWLARLGQCGVDIRTKWRWIERDDQSWRFETASGPKTVRAKVVILALGGASWARLGSDGQWSELLAHDEISIAPFAAANSGVSVKWSPHMKPHLGSPLKSIEISAGGMTSRGEAVISERGLEGGGIYPLSPALRTDAGLVLDLLPTLSQGDLTKRLDRPRGKASLSNHIRKTVGLNAVKWAVLNEFGRPLPSGSAELAALMKALPIKHQGLRPLDEAISTAGGLRREDLTDDLMIKRLPGVFAAGEMLDWEAPTGGYLLTACFATGRWAGLAAARYLKTV